MRGKWNGFARAVFWVGMFLVALACCIGCTTTPTECERYSWRGDCEQQLFKE